jgi:hypothetical protein
MRQRFHKTFALAATTALLFLCACEQKNSASIDASDNFSNPIVPGFAPDPSIVRVDDDFYLINSTLSIFPEYRSITAPILLTGT